jgi:hypothetical protein
MSLTLPFMSSLCFNVMNDFRVTDGPHYIPKAEMEDFLHNRLLGVLTKVDKRLESNPGKDAAAYNGDFANTLRGSLLSVHNAPHLPKLQWLAVLNPNPEEQAQVRASSTVLCHTKPITR